jgi:DNA polymerase-3 subunit delta'
MSEASDIPHPREVHDLIGHAAAEAAFEDVRARGRLHHAWLLTGPEGVGKATFAYRAARRLLGAPAMGPGLGSDPEHSVARQVAARSHPDLLVLDREGSDGKIRKSIPVEQARVLGEFFSKSPASAPHRVAIIDAADDLNDSSANAILKTLEEPPPRGVLLMVCHAPGRLLPTIRSRCRRLAFPALDLETAAAFVRGRAGVDGETAMVLAEMAGGAPGRAWSLAAGQALEVDAAARELIAALPAVDPVRALALAETFRGGEGAERFALLFSRLAARVHERVRSGAAVGEGRLDPWAAAWESLQRIPREAESVNLDRADAFFTALQELRQAARA